MRTVILIAAGFGLPFAATGLAALAGPVTYALPPETAQLRPGPGVETAQNTCTVCHSADYIAIQPPGKGKVFWETEVAKMIKTYKAQISEQDARVIADYLAATY